MTRGLIASATALVLAMLMGAHDTAAQTATTEQIHNELRALKDRAVEAVNNRNKDALLREISPNISFTSMNNDAIHGLDKLQAYYDQMLASPSRIIKAMTLKVDADALSQLYADNRIAVATGQADTHFEMAGGATFDWPLRWTATLTNTDGKWSIVALHFSGNAIDNPLMSAATSFGRWIAGGTGIAGLAIGFFIGWRRRQNTA
jgi:ketosteroid isomerase-like protein